MTLTNFLKILSLFSIILFLPLSSSLNIILITPSEAKINYPFIAEVKADTDSVYDVKIYVKNSSEFVISDIEDEKWKSSRYYVNGAYPSKTKFNIKIEKFADPSEICVKFRLSEKRSSSSPTPEVCYPIKILLDNKNKSLDIPEEKNEEGNNSVELIENQEQEPQASQEIQEDNESSEDASSKKENNKEKISLPSKVNLSFERKTSENPIFEEEIITLNSQQSPAKDLEQVYLSPTQKIRLVILYSFTFVSLLIIILLLLRRL